MLFMFCHILLLISFSYVTYNIIILLALALLLCFPHLCILYIIYCYLSGFVWFLTSFLTLWCYVNGVVIPIEVHICEESRHKHDIPECIQKVLVPETLQGQLACCCICLLENKDQAYGLLPCKHGIEFHIECILKWLEKYNNICPLCRQVVDVRKKHGFIQRRVFMTGGLGGAVI